MSPPEPAEPPLLVLTQRARRRLLGLIGTLAGLLAIPYLVPDLAFLQPWRVGADAIRLVVDLYAFGLTWLGQKFHVRKRRADDQERVAFFHSFL